MATIRRPLTAEQLEERRALRRQTLSRLASWLRGLSRCSCPDPVRDRLYRTSPASAGQWSCRRCGYLMREVA
jgi:hypothetical protein